MEKNITSVIRDHEMIDNLLLQDFSGLDIEENDDMELLIERIDRSFSRYQSSFFSRLQLLINNDQINMPIAYETIKLIVKMKLKSAARENDQENLLFFLTGMIRSKSPVYREAAALGFYRQNDVASIRFLEEALSSEDNFLLIRTYKDVIKKLKQDFQEEIQANHVNNLTTINSK